MMKGLLRVLLTAALLLFPCGVANAARAYHDITCETTSTTGTGTISLGGASGSYLPFSSLFTSGDTVSYGITSGDGKYETGTGVYTSGAPGTLTRVLASSSTGSLLTLVAPSIVCAELNSAWLQPNLGIADSPTFGGETLTGTLSASGQTVDLSTTGKLNTGTIELGHATDTTISRLAASRAGIEGAPVGLYTFAAAAPASPQVGDIWVNSTTLIQYRYTNDGDSSQWVQFGYSGGASGGNNQTFLGSGTWTKPATGSMCHIQAWGGGGSGGVRATTGNAAGGGGGAYNDVWLPMSSLGATETVTVGAGGAAVASSNATGNPGGTTTFGAWLTAYGGGQGNDNAASATTVGGSGGSYNATGLSGVTLGSINGVTGTIYGLGSSSNNPNNSSGFLSAGGSGLTSGNTGSPGGDSVWGGAGGGGTSSTGPVNSVGGTSVHGGNGGNGDGTTPTAGAQPGGGGGAGRNGHASGAGGDGEVIVQCY